MPNALGFFKELIVSEIFGELILEGDIVVGFSDTLKKLTGTEEDQKEEKCISPIMLGNPWPNRTLFYEYGADLSASLKTKIETAIKKWNSHQKEVHVRFWKSSTFFEWN